MGRVGETGEAATSEWGSKVEGGVEGQLSHTSNRQECLISHLYLYSSTQQDLVPCTDRHIETPIMVWQIDLSGKCIVVTGGNRVSRARGSAPSS